MTISGLEAHFQSIDLSKTIKLNEAIIAVLNIDNCLETTLIEVI